MVYRLETEDIVDLLEFIARSEWPIVAGIALWIVRRPLAAMVDRLTPTKVDAWGFKAEFQAKLEKAELLIPEQQPEGKIELKSAVRPESESDKPDDLSGTSSTAADRGSYPPSWLPYEDSPTHPDGVIMSAWRALEDDTMETLYSMLGERPDEPYSLDAAAREIGFNSDEMAGLQQLRDLRNAVVHRVGLSISDDEAARFRIATERLRAKLRLMRQFPPKRRSDKLD